LSGSNFAASASDFSHGKIDRAREVLLEVGRAQPRIDDGGRRIIEAMLQFVA
jgi:hypothetical protein